MDTTTRGPADGCRSDGKAPRRTALLLIGPAAALVAILAATSATGVVPPAASELPVPGPAAAPAAPRSPDAPGTAALGLGPGPGPGPGPGEVCQVLASGRAGRAWLPWAVVAVPDRRVVAVDLPNGHARANVDGHGLLLQRTTRLGADGGADVVVRLRTAPAPGSSEADAAGSVVTTCTVALGPVLAARPLRARRVVLAG